MFAHPACAVVLRMEPNGIFQRGSGIKRTIGISPSAFCNNSQCYLCHLPDLIFSDIFSAIPLLFVKPFGDTKGKRHQY